MFFDPALDLVDGRVLAIINSALVAKLRVMVETDRLIVLSKAAAAMKSSFSLSNRSSGATGCLSLLVPMDQRTRQKWGSRRM